MASKHVVFWVTAVVVFVLDRITKGLVQANIPLNQSVDFLFFSFTHVRNTGTLWGLFQNASWFFILFAMIVSTYLILKYSTFASKYQFALGLILAGALGNLIDRLLYGAVVDFINLHWWPIFNIADSAIVVAIGLILVVEYVHQKQKV